MDSHRKASLLTGATTISKDHNMVYARFISKLYLVLCQEIC